MFTNIVLIAVALLTVAGICVVVQIARLPLSPSTPQEEAERCLIRAVEQVQEFAPGAHGMLCLRVEGKIQVLAIGAVGGQPVPDLNAVDRAVLRTVFETMFPPDSTAHSVREETKL